MKKKILGGGESKGFLRGAGIADCFAAGSKEQRMISSLGL